MCSSDLDYIDENCPMDQIIAKKEKFALFFRDIAIFVRDGIVAPIITELPNPKDISKAASILVPLSSILMNIRKIIMNVAGIVGVLSGEKKLNEKIPPTAFGYTIARFLVGSILDPLKLLPPVEELEYAQEQLVALTAVVDLMNDTMMHMMTVFSEFGQTTSFFGRMSKYYNASMFISTFTALAQILRFGLIEPMYYLFPRPEKLNYVVTQLTAVADILNKVGESMEAISSIMNGFSEFRIDVGQLKNLPIEKLAEISSMISNGVSVSSLSPVGNVTMDTKVAASKAEAQPSTSLVTSDELVEISENSEKQASATEELVDLFKQFLSMMKQSSASGPSGPDSASTELNRVQGKPAKFFRSTTGQVGRGPGKQLTNLGPPRP